MSMTKFIAVLATAAALSASASIADPRDDHHHDRDSMQGPAMHGPDMHGPAMHGPDIGNDRAWRDDRGAVHRDHDRYWRQGYNSVVSRDRIYSELRRHHYTRFAGDPYWYQGRYVVRSFDRSGRPIFIEINPYTASFIGIVRF